jgi:ferredoxin
VPQISAELVGVGGIIGAAYINPAQCRGCGICASECPAKAIQIAHYRDEQMEVKINALFPPSGTQAVSASETQAVPPSETQAVEPAASS